MSSGRDAGDDRGERSRVIGEMDTTRARGAAGGALAGCGKGSRWQPWTRDRRRRGPAEEARGGLGTVTTLTLAPVFKVRIFFD